MKQYTYTLILTTPVGARPQAVTKLVEGLLAMLVKERNYTGVRVVQDNPPPTVTLLHVKDVENGTHGKRQSK